MSDTKKTGSAGGRRKKGDHKVDIGDRRSGSERRDLEIRNWVESLYQDIYLAAYQRGRSEKRGSTLNSKSNEAELDENSPEVIAVMLATLDANFSTPKSMHEFALDMADRGLLIDHTGTTITREMIARLKLA